MRTAIIIVAAIITLQGAAFAADLPAANAPHVVPETEKHIHIGGGFFSHFDDSPGLVTGGGDSVGTLRFRLDRMGWESPFVYLPEGRLTVSLPDSGPVVLEMQRLDYVEDPRTGRLLYRLSAAGPEANVTILADCLSPETASRPVLEGVVLLVTGGVEYELPFRLCGRGEAEAERHLNRVVYLRSDFDDAAL